MAKKSRSRLYTRKKGGRVDFLRKKYVEKIQSSDFVHFLHLEVGEEYEGILIESANDLFDAFLAADPSENKKYLLWMLERFTDRSLNEQGEFVQRLVVEDLTKIRNDLDFLMRFNDLFPVEKRDLGSYKTLGDLYLEVMKTKPKADDLSQTQKVMLHKEEIEIWLDNENWKVVVPMSLEASSVYGKGTKWCTTSENGGVFGRYADQGPLIIIIDKNAKPDEMVFHKFQFHFESKLFMNALDNRIDHMDFMGRNHDIRDAIISNIKTRHAFLLKVKFNMEISEEDKYIIDEERRKDPTRDPFTLDLSDMHSEELIKGLHVEGNVSFRENRFIKKIDGLTVDYSVDLSNSSIEEVGNIKTGDACNMRDCKNLNRIFGNVEVGGTLDLKRCDSLKRLPSGKAMRIYLSHSVNFEEFPSEFHVEDSIYLRHTALSKKLEAEIEKVPEKHLIKNKVIYESTIF